MPAPRAKFLLRLLLLGLLAAEAQAADSVVLIAGDVAQCNVPGARLTGQLIASMPDAAVLAAGDLAYPTGSAQDFARCYAPAWGAFKARTFPAPGNHEYETPGAAGYFDYFGVRAGERRKGYYSFDLGAWHILSLNSQRALEADAAQLQWLDADLRQHRQRCVLAYWHHPRYSSGPHGSNAQMQALWALLQRHGVSVVVAGHEHFYERFAPMNAQGERDALHGMRSFVVGTGGTQLYPLQQRLPLSEAAQDHSWGVLKITLHATGYAWDFLPVAGQTFHDAGSAQCAAR